MAIAFDSKTTSQSAASSTSLTFAFNNVAGDFLIVYGQDASASTSTVTGIKYGGVSMTKAVGGRSSSADRMISIWYLVAPATGSNDVVVTSSTSQALRFGAISYSGVAQSSPTDGTDTTLNQTGATTISTDITTTTDNCWMFMFAKDNAGSKTYSSTTGDTIRLATDDGGHSSSDTGAAITPAGSNTMTHQVNSGTVTIGAIAVAFKPATGAAAAFTPRVSFII
jgi:hypothetical protein